MHNKAETSYRITDEFLGHLRAIRQVKAVVGLFSGGNDSTVMIHLLAPLLTHVLHVNTQTGIIETTEFVRETTEHLGIPYLEKTPPNSYEDLVLGKVFTTGGWYAEPRPIWPGGFPGPGSHQQFFDRLKGRSISDVQREFIDNPWERIPEKKERIVFVAARRASESARRKSLGSKRFWERKGTAIWVSPMLHWTKLDVNRYLNIRNIKTNEVSQLIHMSGECLCGCYAKQNELDEISAWFPYIGERYAALEKKVSKIPGIDPKVCRWGWGQRGECDLGCNNLC